MSKHDSHYGTIILPELIDLPDISVASQAIDDTLGILKGNQDKSFFYNGDFPEKIDDTVMSWGEVQTLKNGFYLIESDRALNNLGILPNSELPISNLGILKVLTDNGSSIFTLEYYPRTQSGNFALIVCTITGADTLSSSIWSFIPK